VTICEILKSLSQMHEDARGVPHDELCNVCINTDPCDCDSLLMGFFMKEDITRRRYSL